jgi:uncharacterized protein
MSTPHLRLVPQLMLVTAFLATACTLLPAQKDTTQFFVLTAASASSRSATGRELSIGVGPIIFPGYLKRRAIVKRLGGGQLQVSDNLVWAESLDSNFQRVLGQDLARQLNTQRVVLFPWYGRPQLDYQVAVEVNRFDIDDSGNSRLEARWIIKDGKTGRQLLARESNISSSVPPSDIAGSETLSTDLNSLSTSIAESMSALARNLAAGEASNF